MSTDVYIDTNDLSFNEFEKTFEYWEMLYNHKSRKTLRIGHINDLSYFPYNIFTELLNINYLFAKLTDTLISNLCKRYMLFLQTAEIVNSTEDDKLKDQMHNYGCNTFHNFRPIIDIVSIQTLLRYLNDNKNKFWKIRVD